MSEVVVAPERPIRLLSLGDTAWTVEFGEEIDPEVHGRVLGLAGEGGRAAGGIADGAGRRGRNPCRGRGGCGSDVPLADRAF